MQLAGNDFLAMTVLVFVSVILLLEGLYLLWQSRHGPGALRLRKRLRAAAGEDQTQADLRLWKDQGADAGPLVRLAQRASWGHALENVLLQSGLRWGMGRLLLYCAVSGIVGALLALVLLPGSPLAWVLPLASCPAPIAYVFSCRSARMRTLERQLPEALDLLVRGLRAGHALSSTLKMAGEELPDPVGTEFRIVHDEINYGVSVQQALGNLAERVPSTDVRYFVVAVLIQRESGGNLTEILGNLSRLIRERLKLLGRVRVLSSEGRLSAVILVLMPFGLAGIMTLLNYEFMSRLWTDPMGIGMIKVLLGLMLVGILMLRKIVRIRV